MMPNLLVAGVADAIRCSSAVKILVCNLMTQRGETDGFSASDHLRVVSECLGQGVVDFCLVNSAPRRGWSESRNAEGAERVTCDLERIRSLDSVPVAADLLMWRGDQIRHNPDMLGQLVVKIARTEARQPMPFPEIYTSQGVLSECFA